MARLRRACLVLTAGFAVWIVIVWLTGGITIWIGEFRLLSARGVRNPFLLALISAAAWWQAAPRPSRTDVLRGDLAWARQGIGHILDLLAAAPRALVPIARAARRRAARVAPWLSPSVGVAAAAGVILVGFLQGIFVVGGSDSWGYVSQAHLWATGTLRIEEPLIRELADLLPTEAITPLGYRASITRDALVPVYAAGYPMVMAVFEYIGGRGAVFYVLPLLAGVAVLSTYLLGRAIAGPAAGAGGALLLATSPAFLAQLTAAPLSDIPAAAWWALALVLVTVDRTSAAAAAGLAAGLAILTRPNLVVLAIFPALLLGWPVLRDRRIDAVSLTRTLLYSGGVVAACLAVAAINAHWYGSALESGYGPTQALYSWSNWTVNVERYWSWLSETQTPLVALAIAAPLFVRSNGALRHSRFGPIALTVVAWCFAATVLGCYLFYGQFDAWWYLRFLLPGFPVLMVFLSVTILAMTRPLPRLLRGSVAAAIIGALAWHGYATARDRSIFFSETERKYAVIGGYVARRLPERAVLLAMQHSGSIRYYSGRPTLRYDLIRPDDIGPVIARLQALHYTPYVLLEGWEIDVFRNRFSASGPLGGLDWPPVAQLPLGDIRIYAATPGASAPGPTPVTEIVPDVY